MTNQEKLDLILSNHGCWLYNRIDIAFNTYNFLGYCRTKENFSMQAKRFYRNSCSTYFKNYHYWFLNQENHLDSYSTYCRYDNNEIAEITHYLDNIILIETDDHKTLWSEREIDGQLLVGRFLISEEDLQDILSQKFMSESQFEEEPTAIRLRDRLYSKEELETMLDQLETLKSIINK